MTDLQRKNLEIIEKTGALQRLNEKDRVVLKKEGKKLGTIVCSVLRHDPEKIGVHMKAEGAWVNVNELIEKFNDFESNQKKQLQLTLPILMEIVRTDNKTRYGLRIPNEYNVQDLEIRCNQGHSIPWVQMAYKVHTPPEFLYHGTSQLYLNSILEKGLLPMKRQKVHLSGDYETAVKVGKRKKGSTIVLQVEARQMERDGGVFYLSENGVWLADCVLPQYIHVKSWSVD